MRKLLTAIFLIGLFAIPCFAQIDPPPPPSPIDGGALALLFSAIIAGIIGLKKRK